MNARASNVVFPQMSRTKDGFGSGQFGAHRSTHIHAGLDIKARAGQMIFAPISGNIIRTAQPYPGDARYGGLVIQGNGSWIGYEIKIFYVEGFFCGMVKAGDHLGFAQDLNIKYKGITNHVHLEVRKNGMLLNPSDIWQQCF
jgi:murein DD-endopeptidase MepM/ murein hydrolase activator NlpD